MIGVPQLDWPLRFVGGQPATVEQDTVDEIAICVETILRYRVGQRPESPDFGIPEPSFRLAPIELDEIRAALIEFEPRAAVLAEQDQVGLDTIIRIAVGRNAENA